MIKIGQRIYSHANLLIVDESGKIVAWLPGGAVMERQQASFSAIKEQEAVNTPPKRASKLPMVLNPDMGRIWTSNASE